MHGKPKMHSARWEKLRRLKVHQYEELWIMQCVYPGCSKTTKQWHPMEGVSRHGG